MPEIVSSLRWLVAREGPRETKCEIEKETSVANPRVLVMFFLNPHNLLFCRAFMKFQFALMVWHYDATNPAYFSAETVTTLVTINRNATKHTAAAMGPLQVVTPLLHAIDNLVIKAHSS